MGLPPDLAVLFSRHRTLVASALPLDEGRSVKALRTIFLSLVAIAASLVFVLSTLCAYGGGLGGTNDRGSYVLCAMVSVAFVVAAMWAIAKMNKEP